MEGLQAAIGATTGATGPSDDEAIRRRNLGRETNLRTLGLLVYLNSIFFFYVAAVGAWAIPSSPQAPTGFDPLWTAVVASVISAIAAYALWMWVGATKLRRLDRGGIWQGRVWGLLSLPGIPIGTVLGVWALCCNFSRQTDFILSSEYREIVARTPHIKQGWSPIVKILAAILAVVLFIGLCGAVLVMIDKAMNGSV